MLFAGPPSRSISPSVKVVSTRGQSWCFRHEFFFPLPFPVLRCLSCIAVRVLTIDSHELICQQLSDTSFFFFLPLRIVGIFRDCLERYKFGIYSQHSYICRAPSIRWPRRLRAYHHGNYLLTVANASRGNKQPARVPNRVEWVIHRGWNAARRATFGGKSANALPGNLTDIICISGDESHCFAAQCNYSVQCRVCIVQNELSNFDLCSFSERRNNCVHENRFRIGFFG